MWNIFISRKLLLAAICLFIGLCTGVGLTKYAVDRERSIEAVMMKMRVSIAYDKGQFDLALGLAHQAAALAPEDYTPYFLMGKIYASQGKREMAKLAYEKALENSLHGTSSMQSSKVTEYDRQTIIKSLEKL